MACPTKGGNMPTVDAKGRLVLPKDVRERLGLTAGSEVDVHEEDGRIVVEPEEDPNEIISDLEALIDGSTRDRRAPDEELDALASDHVETIRRQADDSSSDDE